MKTNDVKQNVTVIDFDAEFATLLHDYKITNNDANVKVLRDVAYKNRNRRDTIRDPQIVLTAYMQLACCAKSKLNESNVLVFTDDIRYIAHRETSVRRAKQRAATKS